MTDETPKRRGRPPLNGGSGYNIRLDEESVSIARALGNGNVSAGVRFVLAQYRKESTDGK